MSINERLKNLRQLMKERGITAYIEPTEDPHQSEYVADYYKGRAYISGFTGSAGIAVITMDQALIWTDGRYFIQAEKEISNSEFKLMKMQTPGYPTYMEWIRDNLREKDTLGFNGKVFSQSSVEKLEDYLKEKKIEFIDGYDLVGEVWRERPEQPKGNIFLLDTNFSGKSTDEKLKEVRTEMKNKHADYFLLSSLDDIAWLFNIRGNDVENTPVAISYGMVTKDNAFLFVDNDKLNGQIINTLRDSGVETRDYEDIKKAVEKIEEDSVILLDKQRTNRWLFKAIPVGAGIIDSPDVTTNLKGVKNPVEIQNQRNAYIKDGIALVKFFHWLDSNLGKMEINELSAEKKLMEFRQEGEGFLQPSFGTISAYKGNAAMMHYSATESSYAIFEQEGLYLVDSGGQYYEGTTDITRTVALGEITQEERRDFTLTLKGHINLIDARFLEGTSGHVLDILSRYPLWQEGIDYKCGTGHGVGYLLSVHEGPHRFSTVPNNVALEEGMIITIEPGVYKEGSHGIRIENVAVVKEDIKTDSGQFMNFEVLSYVPIDLDCIDGNMLSSKEKEWLNNYHAKVYEYLSPYLDENVKEWLKKETRSI